MNIQILNNDLTLHGIVTGFESIEFTRSWNSKGSFKIKINANNQNAKYLKIDKIVYIDEDKIGYIEKVTIDRKTNKAGEYVIAEGIELKDRLNRLIYPDDGLETDSYTSEYLETIIKSLINKNAGSLASTARQIPYLITVSDQQRGEQIDYSARYKDLSTEIYSLLSSQEDLPMGLKVELDISTPNIKFDVAVGENKTAQVGEAGGIVLSLDTKTALEIKDVDDKLSYKNLSVTLGLGEGADRTLREVYSGEEPTGYARREVLTEARDIESDDELPIRGAQKLSEIAKTRAISAKANTLGSYQIGDDYDLGDFISVDANGDLFHAQVTKLKYKFSKESIPEIEVILNFDIEDTLLADISAKHMDYDALVASSAKGNLVAEVVLDADASSITIEDLDINTDGGFYEIIVRGRASANVTVRLLYNGIANSSTYLNQQHYAYNSTHSVSKANNATIGALFATTNYLKIDLILTNNRPSAFGWSSAHYTAGGYQWSRLYQFAHTYMSNITNITSLKLQTTSGNLKAGTVIGIYRR